VLVLLYVAGGGTVVVCNNRGLDFRVVLSLFRLSFVLLFRLPVGRYIIGLVEKEKGFPLFFLALHGTVCLR